MFIQILRLVTPNLGLFLPKLIYLVNFYSLGLYYHSLPKM